MKHHARTFTEIAGKHLNIPTLRTRKSDRLDFHEVSVWAVRSALKAAFDAGVRSSDKNAHQNAAAILLDLIRHRLLSLEEGDAYCEFNSTIYWYDDKAPDWKALVDAIGWEAASTAIRSAEAETSERPV